MINIARELPTHHSRDRARDNATNTIADKSLLIMLALILLVIVEPRFPEPTLDSRIFMIRLFDVSS